jgi:hypothetical protein
MFKKTLSLAIFSGVENQIKMLQEYEKDTKKNHVLTLLNQKENQLNQNILLCSWMSKVILNQKTTNIRLIALWVYTK